MRLRILAIVAATILVSLTGACSGTRAPSTSQTAVVEVDFSPNPVPSQDGFWEWQVTITETNGVGLEFTGLTISSYNGEELIGKQTGTDKLPTLTLGAHEKMASRGRMPCQAISHQK